MINSIINERYRLDDEIGHGGMGIVFRAFDMTLEREVALKLLSHQEVGTKGRARLIREAQTAAKMDHPNIVSVFDAGEYQKSPYIVMPLLEGQTLREYQSHDLDEVVKIVKQICLALEHAHKNGIIHRDLKPENIIRTKDGVIKLMDFGLALSLASRLSTEGTVVGTASYMPPEQVQGDLIDPRADLYSLGIMMYEMVTETLPFNADNLIGLITQHIHAPVVPPKAKREDIPQFLNDLIVKLLSKNPEDRPPNAASVYHALNQTDIVEPHSDSTDLSVLDRIVRGRLVGRKNELLEAQNLWRKVQSGSGQVLLVSGEPGIGKTRLVKEIATLAEVSGGKVFQAASYQEGSAPYEMISQVIRASLSPNSIPIDFPEPVLADMLSITPDLKTSFSGITPNPSLEPQQEKQRLHENLIRFLTQLSSSDNILLLFEDIHWSNNSSLRFVQHLMRHIHNLPILLLMTYREVEMEQSGPLNDLLLMLHRERLGYRIKLQRLDFENTKSMLQVIFAEDITDEFTQGIYQETEGNPFFIEEVCKAMVESGQLFYEDGEWHRPQNMKDLDIPQSIRVVIQSRLSKLEKMHQEVLIMAALFGHEFNFAELQHALDKDENILIDSLEAAEKAQLIRDIGRDFGGSFAFAHALIPAALADNLGSLRRRRMHENVAKAIQTYRPDEYELIAYHFERAGNEELAYQTYLLAADRAEQIAAYEEAYLLLTRALDSNPAIQKDEKALLLKRIGQNMYFNAEQPDKIYDYYFESLALYEDLDEKNEISDIEQKLGRLCWIDGNRAVSMQHYHRAFKILEDEEESIQKARAMSSISQMHMLASEYEDAINWGEKALSMARRLKADEVIVHAKSNVGTALIFGPADNPEVIARGINFLKESHTLGAKIGLRYEAARALHNLSEGLYSRSRYTESRGINIKGNKYAKEFIPPFVDVTEVMGLKLDLREGKWSNFLKHMGQFDDILFGASVMVWNKSFRGWMFNNLGLFEKAREELEHVLEESINIHELQTTVPHLYQLARAYHGLGERSKSKQYSDQFLEMITSNPYPYYDSLEAILFLCYQIDSLSNEIEPLSEYLDILMRHDEILDTPESRGVLHEAKGILARAKGSYSDAEKHFMDAAEIWVEIISPYNQARSLVNLVKVYSLMEEWEKAREISNQAEEILQSLSLELVDFPEYQQAFLESPIMNELKSFEASIK